MTVDPRTSKRLLVLFFVVVLAGMSWVTIQASLDRSVGVAAGELWADPWGRATLVDAYFAFFAVYLWIAYRERTWTARLVWLVLVSTLGNFAIATYGLLALARLPAGAGAEAVLHRPAGSGR